MAVPSFLLNFLTMIPGLGNVIIQLSSILHLIIAFLLIYIVFVFLSKKKPRSADLGFDTKTLTKKNIIIVLLTFVITHLIFYFLSKLRGVTSNPQVEFTSGGFGKGFVADLILIIAGTIIAPVFEELIYRGFMLRSFHDGLLKFSPKSTGIFGIPAILSIILTAIAFILPHVADLNISVMTLAYFVTSAGFSIVYLLTRSMTAAMVSHSLQSCFATTQILIFGHGDYVVSPIVYGISIFCPVIVYFIGTAMQKRYEKREQIVE